MTEPRKQSRTTTWSVAEKLMLLSLGVSVLAIVLNYLPVPGFGRTGGLLSVVFTAFLVLLPSALYTLFRSRNRISRLVAQLSLGLIGTVLMLMAMSVTAAFLIER